MGTNGWDDQAPRLLLTAYCSHGIFLACSKLLLKLLKHVLNSFREMITRGDLQSAHHSSTFIPTTSIFPTLAQATLSFIIIIIIILIIFYH